MSNLENFHQRSEQRKRENQSASLSRAPDSCCRLLHVCRLYTKWAENGWFDLQLREPAVLEFVADVSCVFWPASFQTPAGNLSYCWSRFQLVADSGLDAAVLPVSSLWDWAELTDIQPFLYLCKSNNTHTLSMKTLNESLFGIIFLQKI